MLEVDRHGREIARGGGAGVEVLVFGAERYHQRAALLPIVTNVADDAEARALHDVDGLFTVLVLAGVTSRWNFGDETFGAPCAKPELRRDQQTDSVVLDSFHPVDIFLVGYFSGSLLFCGRLRPHPQPFIVKRHRHSFARGLNYNGPP